jgi:hypothetical protein
MLRSIANDKITSSRVCRVYSAGRLGFLVAVSDLMRVLSDAA